MKLIIGNMSLKMQEFLKNNHFNQKIMMINKMCNVKTIKENVDVIIPFSDINNLGIVNNTQVHIPELIMSLNVKKISYGNIKAKNYLENICQQYLIPLEYLNIMFDK